LSTGAYNPFFDPFDTPIRLFTKRLEEALAAGREAYAFSTLFDGDELFVAIDQLPIDI
jgi:hypothetical protein